MSEKRKEITKAVKQKIREGLSRQKAYDELVKSYPERKVVAEILEGTPSKYYKKKYEALNITLLIMIALTTVIDLLLLSVISVAIDVFFWLL